MSEAMNTTPRRRSTKAGGASGAAAANQAELERIRKAKAERANEAKQQRRPSATQPTNSPAGTRSDRPAAASKGSRQKPAPAPTPPAGQSPSEELIGRLISLSVLGAGLWFAFRLVRWLFF